MTDGRPTQGRIVSFYSFKGGVGRTMALANVAFLAAMNDLRVLVMDWDLEAPGLHHYFRGLLEPDEMAELRSAPGILNLAWAWRNGIDQAQGGEEVDKQFALFQTGSPFEELARPVFQPDFPMRGCLDMIPAGGDMVAIPEVVEYERALAALSWNELLDRYAGGGLIDALRNWASSNYDLVLVDSRTGLADVAGICTMQLPDAVVLSFVLNRQNIEGVARVASAIRRNRDDTLKIWTVPMRVSREGTDEEADATARALRELTRPGRLDRDATERDLKNLLIKAEPNIPFMEALSAFNETNAALDPLTANMARLATEIAGRTIVIPEISEQWRDTVSSRLAPTLSTDTYLRQLLTAEADRAVRAFHGYVESAISTVFEGDELADDYVAALAETVLAFQQRSDAHLINEDYDLHGRLVVLLRKMHERDPETWRPLLVTVLETTLNSDMYWLGPEDEAVALDEIDELLAVDDQNLATLERRVEMRIRAMRLYETMRSPLLHLGAAEEVLALLKAARKFPDGMIGEWPIRRLDALIHRAEAQERLEQPDESMDSLRKVIRLATELDHSHPNLEAQRLNFEACFRLMRLLRAVGGNPEEVSGLAIDAMRRAPRNLPTFATRIPDLADSILAAEPNAIPAVELLKRAVEPSNSVRFYGQLFNRAPAAGARLIESLGALLCAGSSVVSSEELLSLIDQSAEVVRVVIIASAERAFLIPPHRRSAIGAQRQSRSIIPAQLEALTGFVARVRSLSDAAQAQAALDGLMETANEISQRAQNTGHPRTVTRNSTVRK